MKRYIKHIILPVLACLVSAVSCTSDPDSGLWDPEKGEEMSFEVDDGTRASVTTSENLADNPFMLFGDVNRKGEFHTGLRTLFDKAKVTFKKGGWDYGVKQYWQMGQEHSFVAVHPYEALTYLSDIEYSESKVGFSYTLPDRLDEAKDILVATHRRKYTLDNPGAIRFKFTHLLSSINIMPALDEFLMYEDETDTVNYPYNKDEYILFHRIEIIGIRTKASFSFTPEALGNANQTDVCSTTYNTIEGEVRTLSYDYTGKPKKVTNNKENVSIFDDGRSVIVLPQGFSADSESKMILTYTVNDDEPQRTITIPLKGQTWKMGTNYNYKFTIEKAYTGQIKEGSMVIEVDDPRLTDTADDSWVWDGKVIDFTFENPGSKDNQSNNNQEDENE